MRRDCLQPADRRGRADAGAGAASGRATRSSPCAISSSAWRRATRRRRIVFISEGLLLEREYTEVSWVEPRAAAAHVTPVRAAARRPGDGGGVAARTSPSRAADRELLRDGLDQLAGLAEGDVFRVVGNADFAFQRLATGAVRLLPPEFRARARRPRRQAAQDQDRRPPQGPDAALAARVQRRRGRLSLTPTSSCVETLSAPLLATDIPLKLTTYTFQDPDSSKLKIILAGGHRPVAQRRRTPCRSAT